MICTTLQPKIYLRIAKDEIDCKHENTSSVGEVEMCEDCKEIIDE